MKCKYSERRSRIISLHDLPIGKIGILVEVPGWGQDWIGERVKRTRYGIQGSYQGGAWLLLPDQSSVKVRIT